MKKITVLTKRMLALLLAGAMVVPSVGVTVAAQEKGDASTLAAADLSINATNVSLYGLDSKWEGYLSLPADLLTSFRLEVSGASSVAYKVVEGDSVTVSEDGLITPRYTTFYWNGGFGISSPPANGYDRITVNGNYGESTIEVTADGQTFEVTVDFQNYAQVYTDRVLDEFIAANVTDSMTDYEKLELATKYAADHEYSTSFSSTAGMVISGGGDCVASSCTIVDLCKKMGINAWLRSAAREYVNTTHWNVMVEIDGKYYVADAGYSEPAPRYYSIRERSSLFCYRTVSGGIELIQYDGNTWPSVMEIPSEIDGKTVIGLGEDFVATGDMTEVVLPDIRRYMNMKQLSFKTRGQVSPQGKPRVYFTCHPADFARYFESISDEILEISNCAVCYMGEDIANNLRSDISVSGIPASVTLSAFSEQEYAGEAVELGKNAFRVHYFGNRSLCDLRSERESNGRFRLYDPPVQSYRRYVEVL